MYDLAAIAIGAACFAFAFVLLWVLEPRLMSAADAFGLAVSLRDPRLPRLRPLPRGALLDDRPGHRPDRRLRGRPDRARLPARPLHGPRLHDGQRRRSVAGSPPASAASTGSFASTRGASRTGRATRRRCSSSASSSRPCSMRSSGCRGICSSTRTTCRASPPHIALNTEASFVTNTNWQYYGGEYTMSYLTQMAGLAVQNFVSAAVGIAVLAAVVRGFARRSAGDARQLLGRPLPLARLRPAAAGADPRRDPDLAGRAADVRRARDRDDARGRDADDRARPGRVADRDQAARHERRRLLQLELGRSVREPERVHELPRAARRSC